MKHDDGPGIYCIQNIVTGHRYIGKAVSIKTRTYHHRCALKKRKHHNSHLQEAYNKYGAINFEFTILEKVPEDMLDIRERAWISYYRSAERECGYNLESGGNLGKTHAYETCTKISKSNRDTRDRKREEKKSSLLISSSI